jgi:hypothetical protein
MNIWPQLSVRRGRQAVEFYRQAFGAEVDHLVGGTDENESLVAQLSVAGAVFWVSDESPEHGNHSPESLGGATAKMLLVVTDPGDRDGPGDRRRRGGGGSCVWRPRLAGRTGARPVRALVGDRLRSGRVAPHRRRVIGRRCARR